MTHRHVSVGAHHREEDGAGELVDRGRREVDLAHGLAKDPVRVHTCDDEDGDADEEALVGKSQVEDVEVGDRLHLGVAEDDVDDEGVAAEAHHADQCVEDL